MKMLDKFVDVGDRGATRHVSDRLGAIAADGLGRGGSSNWIEG